MLYYDACVSVEGEFPATTERCVCRDNEFNCTLRRNRNCTMENHGNISSCFALKLECQSLSCNLDGDQTDKWIAFKSVLFKTITMGI